MVYEKCICTQTDIIMKYVAFCGKWKRYHATCLRNAV